MSVNKLNILNWMCNGFQDGYYLLNEMPITKSDNLQQ